jgi:hypothetical protein
MKEERIDGEDEDEEASGEESCEIYDQKGAEESGKKAGEKTDRGKIQVCSQESNRAGAVSIQTCGSEKGGPRRRDAEGSRG